MKNTKTCANIDDVLRDSESHRLACRKCGATHHTNEIVRAFFDGVLERLKAGDEVYIHGFGRFMPKLIAGRSQMVGLPTVIGEDKAPVKVTFGDRNGVRFKLAGTAKDLLNPKLAKQKAAAKTRRANAKTAATPKTDK